MEGWNDGTMAAVFPTFDFHLLSPRSQLNAYSFQQTKKARRGTLGVPGRALLQYLLKDQRAWSDTGDQSSKWREKVNTKTEHPYRGV